MNSQKQETVLKKKYKFTVKNASKKPKKKSVKSKKYNYIETSFGEVFNVNTGKTIKYTKISVKRIKEALEKKLSVNLIDKSEFDEYILNYDNKIRSEEEHSCELKGKLWYDADGKCLTDNIKNRFLCGYLLTDEQTEELTEKILSQSDKVSKVVKYRKKTDYQWSEYIFAVLLKNPHLVFDLKTIKQIDNIYLSDTQKQGFLKDLDESFEYNSSFVINWFNKAKKEIGSLYEIYPNLVENKFNEVYLTGKTITEPKIKRYLATKEKGRDKVNKGDIYLLSKIDGKDIFLGFSIKKSKDATLINWSIEQQFKKLKESEYTKLKEAQTIFMSGIGMVSMSSSAYHNLSKSNRKLYEEIRENFNEAMKGTNLYKDTIREIIESNEKYFIGEIIGGIGALTSYPTYLFDGESLTNLNNLYKFYKQNLTDGRLKFISDNKKNNSELKSFGIKEYYSDNAGKIWYYIKEGDEFKYRFEIRTKGNPYASLQFQMHKI
jgi:hypothetical protein